MTARSCRLLPCAWLAFLICRVHADAGHIRASPQRYVEDDMDGFEAKRMIGRTPLGDGCARVYVDVGTNIGVQIRKLFEPDKYNGSEVLPLFDKYFGSDRANDGDLCAFGFEPNPLLASLNKELERSYVAQGWRVKIFTETAVGTSDGNVSLSFSSSKMASLGTVVGNVARKVWPGSISTLEQRADVRQIDLARFMREDIFFRRIPARGGRARPPAVVMKLDIEGAELNVVPHMMAAGVFCHINLTYAEWHLRLFGHGTAGRRAYSKMMRALDSHMRQIKDRPDCQTDGVIALDDELFAFDDGRAEVEWGSQEARRAQYNRKSMSQLPPFTFRRHWATGLLT